MNDLQTWGNWAQIASLVVAILSLIAMFVPRPAISHQKAKKIRSRLLYAIIATFCFWAGTIIPITDKSPTGTITFVSNVAEQVDISGTYANVPEDQELWLYIYPSINQRYWLQPVIASPDGSWQVKNVNVGEPQDSCSIGTPSSKCPTFSIGLITADTMASVELHKNALGLDFLPSGTQRLQEIVVTRK